MPINPSEDLAQSLALREDARDYLKAERNKVQKSLLLLNEKETNRAAAELNEHELAQQLLQAQENAKLCKNNHEIVLKISEAIGLLSSDLRTPSKSIILGENSSDDGQRLDRAVKLAKVATEKVLGLMTQFEKASTALDDLNKLAGTPGSDDLSIANQSGFANALKRTVAARNAARAAVASALKNLLRTYIQSILLKARIEQYRLYLEKGNTQLLEKEKDLLDALLLAEDRVDTLKDLHDKAILRVEVSKAKAESAAILHKIQANSFQTAERGLDSRLIGS